MMLKFSPPSTLNRQAFSSPSAPKVFSRRMLVQCASARSQAPGVELGRRQLLELAAVASIANAAPALAAAKAPKGFTPFQDRGDGYQFAYPFGWQEVAVRGQDVVFKDIVEPLESVSVSLIGTDKQDIEEFGDPALVAETLAKQVLTPSTQQVTMLNSELRDTNGQKYLEFEFLVETPRYKRHSLAVVTVANGKFYTLTTGANERRWPKMENSLKATIRSFQMIDYSDVSLAI